MPAQWVRVTPGILNALSPLPGGQMVMATLAKKHLTVFVRSRRAPGAGHPSVKAKFTEAAHKTLGMASRADRNAVISTAVSGSGPGKIRRVSRARPGSPLHGKVYEISTK